MHRKFLVILLILFSLNAGLFAYLEFSSRRLVLGDLTSTPPNVQVSGSVDFCPTIIITPEHRIPPTHNNSLQIEIWIRPEGSTTPIYTTTVTTDNEGVAQVCYIPFGLITDRYYDVLIKGLSHLRRDFTHQDFGGKAAVFVLDLHDPVLFAGDSHPVNDNYVNSMDVSYEITKLYGNDLRADLNRDGIVNSLEFPTLISHLYQHGDN